MTRRDHAVVLGASMTGLGAARALVGHFDEVTLVERDVLPERATFESRKGVPQGNHAHALLASGYQILDAWFPTLIDELAAEGGRRIDAGGDFLIYQFGAWKLRTDLGVHGLAVSRPRLEAGVRRHVRMHGKITIVDDHDVLEPVYDPRAGRVTGVRVRDRSGAGERVLDADLVVDATGRGSVSPRWLQAWGFDEVPETQVKCDVGYATGNFPHRPGDCHGAYAALMAGTPPTFKRGAGMFAVEGGRWVVTLACWLRDYPPTDLEGFREFARSLPVPTAYDVVKDREPMAPIVAYRFPANRQRHYDRLTRFPDGYLVIGDAICSFNPIYGQGMSVALLEAQALDECLAAGDAELARRFFARTANIVANPWSIAVGEDLRFPDVEGPRPFGFGVLSRYMARVHAAAAKDRVVMQRFAEVAGLLAEPAAILHPRIAWRVLLGGIGQSLPSPDYKLQR